MPVPTLRTQRLVLRQLRQDDAAALHTPLSDPALMTWWSSAAHTSLEQTQAYVSRNAEDAPWLACWAITRDGGTAIGWVILIERRKGVQELGYLLCREAWGHGYAREAASAVIAHGFTYMGQRRVMADIDPDNAASIRLVESLGFTLEGRLRGEWETHIGVRDSLIYGLLVHEWQEQALATA